MANTVPGTQSKLKKLVVELGAGRALVALYEGGVGDN